MCMFFTPCKKHLAHKRYRIRPHAWLRLIWPLFQVKPTLLDFTFKHSETLWFTDGMGLSQYFALKIGHFRRVEQPCCWPFRQPPTHDHPSTLWERRKARHKFCSCFINYYNPVQSVNLFCSGPPPFAPTPPPFP